MATHQFLVLAFEVRVLVPELKVLNILWRKVIMKKATCKDLRGPCDFEVVGDTAEEMGDAGKKHVMEMVAAGDEDHKVAMDSMMNLKPDERQKWYQEFTANFDSLQDA